MPVTCTPGGIFSGTTDGAGIGYGFGSTQVVDVGYMCLFATCQGVKPICQQVTSKSFNFPDQGCWQYYSGTSDNPFMITDRENVINLHMGIPKANGLRDDVQLLWSGSAVNNYVQSEPERLSARASISSSTRSTARTTRRRPAAPRRLLMGRAALAD